MGDIRTWLRGAVSSAGGRVYFRIPERPTYPLIRLSQVGGGPEVDEGVLLRPRLSIEVISADYATTTTVSHQLVEVLFNVVPSRIGANAGTYLADVSIDGIVELTDPDRTWPRAVITATATVRLAGSGDLATTP